MASVDKVGTVLVAVTFFCWGAWCGAWQMRRVWRRAYYRLARERLAQSPQSPDQGGD